MMELTPVKELLKRANKNLGQAESHASLKEMHIIEAEIIRIRNRLDKLINVLVEPQT